ncbi:amidohydrolase family protein [Sphingomonas sp. S2-65]|uniref:amidohydrolase family protein n=1 Tax=Sphingomonas sp. S2-65 TaxID=2903960 RepID=UPI001F1D3589|nr:amidohydrolase family protein [Sphingomonas sp. S2-65]UYY59340.1 amidohydrolase family protein [Sphingomonas sp. S2-65]
MIDAHVHVWQLGRHGCIWPTPDLAPIHRDFTLADYPGDAGLILVQTQEDARDTAWLLALAQDPRILGVVGWADLERPESIPAHPKLKGLRPMVQGRAPDWYDRPELAAGFEAMAARGLVLDALVRPAHLPALARLAARHPDLTIVVDHAAKPDFADLPAWSAAIAGLAPYPNVACKLSGLLTELAPGAGPDALRPAFDTLWRLFGPDRLLWGSDWPVVTLAASHADWLALAQSLVPAEHHAAIFAANAARIYRLD